MRRKATDHLAELSRVVRPYCEKYGVRRLEVFGSVALGTDHLNSDVDLLVTLGEPTTTARLLEMAGEAEEIIGAPVDFVLRSSLERSPNTIARDQIPRSAVCIYGS